MCAPALLAAGGSGGLGSVFGGGIGGVLNAVGAGSLLGGGGGPSQAQLNQQAAVNMAMRAAASTAQSQQASESRSAADGIFTAPQRAAGLQEARSQRRRGISSTIATSPLGVTANTPTQSATLLGL